MGVVQRLVQSLVTVTRLNCPTGAPICLLNHIITNESIISLVNNRHTGEPYTDNLCLFRYLALHEGAGERGLKRASKAFFERYLQESCTSRADFDDSDVYDLELVEELFQLSIHAYTIDALGHAAIVRRSIKDYPPMYVNQFENHYSYITDIRSYSECFVCQKCDKIFSKPYGLSRHEQTCNVNVKHPFPGRTYQITKQFLKSYLTWVF